MTASPGELLVVGYEGLAPPPSLLDALRDGRLGGVVLFGRNLGTLDEIAAAVAALGATAGAGPPPIVAIDQEGGRVQRIREPLTRWPPMAKVGALDDAEASRAVGLALGRELRWLGFNVDFAPVLDVHTNPANPVIGDRAFAVEAAAVARHALAFWRGLEAAGVRGCGKHFPGHGDTHQDSHLELPRVAHDRDRLWSVELAPFRAAVAAGIPMVMTAHVIYDAVDARPATMSSRWIGEVLRGELGYRGVVVSDDLDMKAVASHYTVEEVVREGLRAGVDLFLACREPERQAAAGEALARAASDPALRDRVAESQARVRRLRESLANATPVAAAVREAAMADPAHRALAARFTMA